MYTESTRSAAEPLVAWQPKSVRRAGPLIFARGTREPLRAVESAPGAGTYVLTPVGPTRAYRTWDVPHWTLALAAAILPLIAVGLYVRNLGRRLRAARARRGPARGVDVALAGGPADTGPERRG